MMYCPGMPVTPLTPLPKKYYLKIIKIETQRSAASTHIPSLHMQFLPTSDAWPLALLESTMNSFGLLT